MNFVSEVEFQQCECQEFCIRVADGTHGTPLQSDFGKKLVTSKNIQDGRLSLDNAYLISNEDFDEINRRSKVEQWDILLSMIGTVGEVCLVDAPEPDFAIKNVGLLKCGDKNRAKWLYYFLRSSAGRQLIEKRKKGTTQQYIALGEIRRLPIPFPSVAGYMKTVTDLLSVFDDRITLLRETNATLEAIAQALFKSWFVDFDPVHAKQQGLAPEGMDEATAALFPDSFEESELGLVPRGWRYSSVGQLFKLTMGQSPPGDTYNNLGDGLPFYQGRTDFGFRFPTKRIFCTSPTRLAESGDTLISVRAPVGDVNMAIERCCLGRGVAGVRHPMGYRSFAFYSIRGLHDKFDMHNSEGTVFGSINKKDFETLPVIGPTQGILAAFDDISSPLDNLVVENEEQIRTLTTLRDTLLPRLISGQLRLSEADAS